MGGGTGTGGSERPVHDFSDPDIGRMVELHHEPKEVWGHWRRRQLDTGLDLLSIDCHACRHPWPCPTITALREHMKQSARDF